MELSFVMKIRIAVALGLGIIVIGILAWPLTGIEAPVQTLTTLSGNSALILAGLSLAVGFAAYFLTWPFGRDIAILAVPAGLLTWTIRSANMTALIKANPAIEQRQQIFSNTPWETVFWLTIIAGGMIGVLVANLIAPAKRKFQVEQKKLKFELNTILTYAAAVLMSAVIAQIALSVLAQDIRMPDEVLGSVVGQPATGQIFLAGVVSFGLAAFAAKVLLDVSYIWPMISAVLVSAYAARAYTNDGVIQHLAGNWAADYFNTSSAAVLPLQMACLACMGSVAGYWFAISFLHWRKHGE